MIELSNITRPRVYWTNVAFINIQLTICNIILNIIYAFVIVPIEMQLLSAKMNSVVRFHLIGNSSVSVFYCI